ncbi:O-antigen ligase [Enterococcus avium]|uniref:O-antigen ligase n=1 Tax=Enterococcus avium TaxID=33945 RepID=A0ABD5FES8_ENTAV|nr:O-antigen polymerase [Enterococcus avium]MDT2433691.1 O-antigen ligase [Enterococcus avium]MDT2464034.1 O-antigen ligase [Enterococcus avium]MDT2485531.1 O-antigen ligase [Enterococcus avium]MDT2503453.1 O-antigen ligase [Enterococcus avium]MDT2512088.1 O-antigen ligase [Enterococcus avium]
MLIFILFIIEIFLIFLMLSITQNDIFRPSILMISVFALSTFFALLNVFNWNINYSQKAFGIIILGFLVAIFADYYMYYLHKNLRGEHQDLKVLLVDHWKIFVVILFELISIYLYYQEIKRLAAIGGYVEGANLLWHFRNVTSYEAEASINGLVNLLIRTTDAFGYIFTFALIQNYLSKKIRLSQYIIYIVPVGLFAFKVLMGSGRQELLKWVAFSLIVSYLLYQYRTGWSKSVSFKYIKRGFILIPIVLILFYLATNIIGRGTTRTFFQYISTYAGGSIQHFNQYVTNPPLVVENHFGAETFPGIYSFLNRFGITNYTRSVHLEMRQLGITQGNIYTFFRRPYHDFGLIGMCLMTFFVILFFSGWYSSFKGKILNRKTNYSIICYSYLVYWIILSSIENYSIGIISIGTVITLVIFKIVYIFLFSFSFKKGIITFKSME